jgi:hypothetical protein
MGAAADGGNVIDCNKTCCEDRLVCVVLANEWRDAASGGPLIVSRVTFIVGRLRGV